MRVSNSRSSDRRLNALTLLAQRALLARDPREDTDPKLGRRAAAVRYDWTFGNHRMSDSSEALRIWQGVVQGHCPVLDSFDAGGRHFVLIDANAHDSGRWPELTRREHQVVACASLGESRKATGYRLGISPCHVSSVLKSAMRKLGVKTQAQLVYLMRSFQQQANPY